MIKMEVYGACVECVQPRRLTTGMVGTEVNFCFDEDWRGLSKCAVFTAGEVVKDVLLHDDACVIPHEVLATSDLVLFVGVRGINDSGDVVISTMPADIGIIHAGTDPSGDESYSPTPDVVAQMQSRIEALEREGTGGGSAVGLDTTLTVSGKAADAKAVGDALSELETKIHEGETGGVSDYTELANKPKINGVEVSGDKTSADYGIGNPTNEQVASSVEAWLDAHPEATTTVADGSITPNKTSFLLKKKINLYDASAATLGKFDDATQTSFTTSGYIPVKKAVYNVTTKPWYIRLYNGETEIKTFTPASETIDLTERTEEFDALRMATYGAAAPNNMMFVEGELPEKYVAYDAEENTVALVTDEVVKRVLDSNAYQYLLESGFPVEALDFLVGHPCNLCDFSKAEQGYVNSNGSLANSTVYTTDYIPVEEGATYYGVGQFQSGFYDAEKNFVKNFGSQDIVDGVITVPVGEGIAYMRSAKVDENTVIRKGVDNPSSVFIPPTKSFHMVDDYARKDFRAYLMGTLGARWFAVGDSITSGYGATTNYVNIINGDWLYHVTNYGIPATMLTSTSGNGDGMCERIKTYDETKCDIITVCGGINDKNNGVEIGTMEDIDTTTVYGALKDICNTFLIKYAGKRCGFITPLKYTAGETSEVTKAIKEVAAHYSIPVLDMESEFGYLFNYTDDVRTAFTADGLHPNTAGQALMARKIGNWLLTL